MNKIELLKIILVTLVILLVGIIITYFTYIFPKLNSYEEVHSMEIIDVNITEIKNGIYRGGYSFDDLQYEVEVTINNQIIEKIEVLKNDDSVHAIKAKGVLDSIIEHQTLKVDVISGATTTSKVLLKAVETALLAN